MSCPQCKSREMRCDDAMQKNRLGTRESGAKSRQGRKAEFWQRSRVWCRVGVNNFTAPHCVIRSVESEARINRVWIQLAHGTREIETSNAMEKQ